jgi:signal transduction histidine kinase/ligand-binding sensor domain-containing protein/CheY-like chemotaxis protein
MIKRFAFIGIIVFLFLPLFSQSGLFRFQSLTVKEGLTNNWANCVIRDHQGFLWVGTREGLNRYDGYKFTQYLNRTNDSTSVSNNHISCLFVDSEGELWVGTAFNGLNRYDRTQDRFIRYTFAADCADCISSDNIQTIFEDQQNRIWIGTLGGGISIFDKKTGSFAKLHENYPGPANPANDVTSIVSDNIGRIWIANRSNILECFDPGTGLTDYLVIGASTSNESLSVSAKVLFIDSRNRLWIGTNPSGLWMYNIARKTFKRFMLGADLNNNLIKDIIEFEKDKIWIATDNGGINIYDSETESFSYIRSNPYDPYSLGSNGIYDLYVDQQGILWVATFEKGVSVYSADKYKFYHYQHILNDPTSLSFNNVISLFYTRDKKLLIGTDGGGLNVLDPKTNDLVAYEIADFPKNNFEGKYITAVFEDAERNLWISSFQNGFSILDKKSNKITNFLHDETNKNTPGDNSVWFFFNDSRNNMWIGTSRGLDLFDKKKGVFRHFLNNPDDKTTISSNAVMSILEDRQQNLWIGTAGGGLNKYDYKTGTFKRFQHNSGDKSSLSNDVINALFQDKSGKIWISTSGGGINCFDAATGEFKSYSTEDGLPCNTVYDILEDKNGNLWLSTTCGMSEFNPVTLKFSNFTENDGLQSNQFSITASAVIDNGDMFFGGINGLTRFNPVKIITSHYTPQMVITDLQVFNRSVSLKEVDSPLKVAVTKATDIYLSYKDRVFTLEFAALDFVNPEKIRYRYKLEGFNKDWIETDSKRRYATFTNLPGKKYIFRVSSTNSDGFWTNNEYSLRINIKPPLYKTWWFLVGVFCFITGSSFIMIQRRIRFINNQRKLLQLLVAERTKELEDKNQEIIEQHRRIKLQHDLTINQKKEIELQKDEIELHRNELEIKVEQRTHDLLIAKEKAENADKLKTSFLANMSHEIRTPMNAIMGFLGLYYENEYTDQEREVFRTYIEKSSKDLLQIIDDILDIARIEANELTINYSTCNINALLTELYDIYTRGVLKAGHDVKLIYEPFDKQALFQTDALRLRQILINLIDNALKFTEKGSIRFGCYKEPEYFVFYVKDTGIGISEENREVIFDSFSKIENHKRKLYRGTGLGLTLAKKLTELLGGRIWVESNINKGSVFFFSLPNTIAPAEEVTAGDHTSMNPEQPDWKNKTILIVEDEETNFLYLKKLLKFTGAIIIRAKTGLEAIDTVKQNPKISLVLMDIKLPGMDGIEATSIIKEIEPLLPVIAQTAYAMKEDQDLIDHSGFDDYIAKPIDGDKLKSIIRKFLIP